MTLTPGNIDDRKPVPDLLSGLFGKIFGVSEAYRRYRGYVSEKLASQPAILILKYSCNHRG